MSVPQQVPSTVEAKVFIKFGQALSNTRRGIRTPFLINIDLGESLHMTAARIREGLRNAHSTISFPNDIVLYLKTSTNCRQTAYSRLAEDNWQCMLQEMLRKFRLRAATDRMLELFVYVEQEPAPQEQIPPQAIRRATAARVQAAATAIQEHFDANPEQPRPGLMEMRYISEHNARLPDSAPLEFPENALRRQLQMIESMDATPAELPSTVTLRMRLNGIWIPVEINAVDIRAAFLTQNVEQRQQILRENFATVAVNQRDVDHEE